MQNQFTGFESRYWQFIIIVDGVIEIINEASMPRLEALNEKDRLKAVYQQEYPNSDVVVELIQI